MLKEKLLARRLHVLIVEDNDLLRRLFYNAFRDLHIMHAVSTVKEGWEIFLSKAPDVIFLDINLPDGNGHDLAWRIKEHNPEAYIVMATVSDASDDRKEANENHVDGFIVKPFGKQKIVSYIEHYLDIRFPRK